MRVLYLAPSSPSDAALTAYSFLDEEILALQDAGTEVFVITTDDQRDRVVRGVQIRGLPDGTSWRERSRTAHFLVRNRGILLSRHLVRQFREIYHVVPIERLAADLVRQCGIDVIHSHFGWPAGFGGLLAAASTGTPLVASFRGSDLILDPPVYPGLRENPAYDWALRALLRNADRTTYVSDFMRELGVRLGADPASAITVHKGVDTRRFSPVPDRECLRSQLGVEGSMVLSVCALIPLKGLNFILSALAKLDRICPFTFVICGEGPELTALQRQCRRLSLSSRVLFRGHVPRSEIPNYFAACDVFVLGSVIEGSGNVLLEAMASSRPVITTDFGGPPEYVRDAETGFIVPFDDTDAMAEKLRFVLENPDIGDAMGRNGRARMENQFSYVHMIDKIRGIYAKVGRLRGEPERIT